MKKAQWLNESGLFVLSLLTHLPFINNGYGREEDAWAQALNAKIISETGIYEVSRLPGHPVYELLLAGLWNFNHSYWFFNLLSTLATAMSVVFFYRIAQIFKVQSPLWLAAGFSFVPVFFIAGSYTIDYNFALLFVMGSFYFLLRKKILWSALLIGIAAGFRISSIGFLLPWILMFYNNREDLADVLKLYFVAIIVAVICYLPPYFTYDLGFLDFHKPPYSSLSKIIYKLSFGVWGAGLLIFFLYYKLKHLFVKNKRIYAWSKLTDNMPVRRFIPTLIIIVLMQLVIFLRLPFKSEFFIPAIPFIILAFGLVFNTKDTKHMAIASIVSCFLLGFDYNNPYRGAPRSSLALNFEAGGKTIYADPIQGPAVLDHRKRSQKSRLVHKIIEWTEARQYPAYVLAGWYWPEILLKMPAKHPVRFDYYSQEIELEAAQTVGMDIFFLPEINEANAEINQHYLADSLGTLLAP